MRYQSVVKNLNNFGQLLAEEKWLQGQARMKEAVMCERRVAACRFLNAVRLTRCYPKFKDASLCPPRNSGGKIVPPAAHHIKSDANFNLSLANRREHVQIRRTTPERQNQSVSQITEQTFAPRVADLVFATICRNRRPQALTRERHFQAYRVVCLLVVVHRSILLPVELTDSFWDPKITRSALQPP